MSDSLQCPYCKKRLKTERGVTQHIFQTPACKQKQYEAISSASQPAKREATCAHGTRRSNRLQQQASEAPVQHASASRKIPPPDLPDPEPNDMPPPADDSSDAQTDAQPKAKRQKRPSDEGDEADYSNLDSDSNPEDTDDEATTASPGVNTAIRDAFRSYCDEHANDFLRLTKEDATSIKLMDVLKRKAPLNTYPSVMEWHLKETGKLRDHETLGDAIGYHHRATLMKRLLPRYNLLQMVPREKKVRLPSSRAVVSIPVRDAADCIVSLLTDPRFLESDYLFFGDDPLAPPPEKVTYLSDLNTGDAYLKSYEKMIHHDRQVLLPVPIYIDGAVTGQFTDLPVTAVKISLGIHSREARDRQYAWRELGFIPVVRKDPARGKKIFQESGHLESQDVIVLEGEGDANPEASESDQDETPEDGAVKAQDFHTMLKTILQSFVELQRTGFVWDLVYKGKLYRDIEFVLFVPFVKCDTEEADVLCGKYTVRTKNVKHVCRYCHCPTSDADNPLAKYPLKTQPEIQKLVEKGKLARLQAMSQQYIENAWYDVRFHSANECGIHGATPSEKLHAIQLGIFKYLREIFFIHMGKSSQLAENINGLATMYGKLLTRQSERDLPNTNFAKGIQKGKLMARDFRGVLLIMAAVLASKKGRELLFQRKKFGKEEGLRDWTLLVELMLEWESYLGEKVMKRDHVVRLQRKHRFIMYIMKQVADRTAGMGLKIMKFHSIIHLINDMLLYGSPSEFDTGSNESHHKESKYAAKLTQRKESTFNLQTAQRLTEFMCIDLAMEELLHDRCVWEYFLHLEDKTVELEVPDSDEDVPDRHDANICDQGDYDSDSDSDSDSVPEIQIHTGGTRIKIYEDSDDEGKASFQMLSRSKTQQERTVWVQEAVNWLNDLQNLVAEFIPEPHLPVLTEHKRGGSVFYGHPNFRSSGPWKDWALIDWGDGWGTLPSHIWCFISLQNMPTGNQRLSFGGITLQDGVYAMVEVSQYEENEALQSDLFIPLTVEVEGFDKDGEVSGRKFYLANTEAIVGPCCVVPNIGGEKNAYFQVKPRRDWSKLFIEWLKAPHEADIMVLSETEEDD